MKIGKWSLKIKREVLKNKIIDGIIINLMIKD